MSPSALRLAALAPLLSLLAACTTLPSDRIPAPSPSPAPGPGTAPSPSLPPVITLPPTPVPVPAPPALPPLPPVPPPPPAPVPVSAADVRAVALRVLPLALSDRTRWADDIATAFAALSIPAQPHKVCALAAVIEQESTWQADPPVANLSKIAKAELDKKRERYGIPKAVMDLALSKTSPDGRTYQHRLDTLRTERELSDLYEDMIREIPMGTKLFEGQNPVRTGGSTQVSVAFAAEHMREKPYPWRPAGTPREEVFKRRGGLYFGAAHLLGYAAPYERMLHRFADFNAGRWASRNAAFQNALSVASGLALALDGDLLPRDGSGRGETERAALTLAERLGLGETAIRRDLERGDGPGFEQTALYERVFAWAEQLDRRALPRAVLPRIDLASPKITRRFTTEGFARRVDERHQRCLARLGAPLSPRPADG